MLYVYNYLLVSNSPCFSTHTPQKQFLLHMKMQSSANDTVVFIVFWEYSRVPIKRTPLEETFGRIFRNSSASISIFFNIGESPIKRPSTKMSKIKFLFLLMGLDCNSSSREVSNGT